jgi:MOSC domain-containing protein YiiM
MELAHLYISAGHNFFGHHGQPPGAHPMVEVSEAHCRAGRGLEGDRFFDYQQDYKGQITFFALEVYEALCAQLSVRDKPPSVFRRNVITRHADLPSLIGAEFEIQGVRFLGVEECAPCHWMNLTFHPDAEKAMQGRGGLRARILSDGVLRVSERTQTPPSRPASPGRA